MYIQQGPITHLIMKKQEIQEVLKFPKNDRKGRYSLVHFLETEPERAQILTFSEKFTKNNVF